METAFGDPATIATLDKGQFGVTGADVFLVPNGSSFDQYFYDSEDGPGWFKLVSGSPVSQDPGLVVLPSGLIFSNEGAAFNLKDSPPSYYSSL